MANEEHLKILKQGVEVWNRWWEDNPGIRPALTNTKIGSFDLQEINFRDADFTGAELNGVNMEGGDLSEALLMDVRIRGCNLQNALLRKAYLTRAVLFDVDLNGANLYECDLNPASFLSGSLEKAMLNHAGIYFSTFSGVNLRDADFSGSVMYKASFNDVDLSQSRGLDSISHQGSSTIGLDTLYRSAGLIPVAFLRGCGIPDNFITFIPSHFGSQQAIQFYSCFIIYSAKDEEFAWRLYSRMRDEGLRVWSAPEGTKGGHKLHEQIERAIQLHDRLLMILSEDSMESEWVVDEMLRAQKEEVSQKRRKLFPIRVVNFETIKKWKCFDGSTGRDLAVELREYYIPDFSDWKDHDAFEREFAKLMRDLRAEEAKQADDVPHSPVTSGFVQLPKKPSPATIPLSPKNEISQAGVGILPSNQVFISHSSKDKLFVRKLIAELADRNIAVWLGEAEVDFGDTVDQEISRNLAESRVFLVVLSSNSIKSEWVKFEVAQAMNPAHKRRIIPILLDAEADDFPNPYRNLLTRLRYLDFRLAADWQLNVDQLTQSINATLRHEN